MMNKLNIVLLLLVFLFSCKENSSVNNDYGAIRGKVYDSKTNELLSWVELSTTPPTSVQITGQDGSFRFTSVPAGEYKIKAMKYGYITREVSVKVWGGKETIADLLLTKGTTNGTDTSDVDTSSDINKYLIAYYKFDGNAFDYSNNHLNGSGLLVGYTQDRKGETEKAIEFYGNNQSYVDVPFNPIFNLLSFTYSFWINPNTGYGIPDYAGYIDIISRWGHWGPNTTAFAFTIRQDGTIAVLIYRLMNPNNYGASENYSFVYSKETVSVGQWTHIVITHDANTKITRIYINGKLDTETMTLTPQSSTSYGLRIGNRIDVTQTYLNAKLDDLRIYSRALTENDIKQLYNE
jgi:hypothetical protein